MCLANYMVKLGRRTVEGNMGNWREVVVDRYDQNIVYICIRFLNNNFHLKRYENICLQVSTEHKQEASDVIWGDRLPQWSVGWSLSLAYLRTMAH